MCENKKIIAKTLKEFNCYKEFRRNYSNPKLGNDRRILVRNILNGEFKERFTMRSIIDWAFVWRYTPEGNKFWDNIYLKILDFENLLYEKSQFYENC